MERSTSWSKDALQAMETHLRLLHSSAEATTESPLASATISSPVSLQAVDLNSQEPLPHGWEQFLHLQTGQVYYVDWKSCRRSYMDPRKLQTSLILHQQSNTGGSLMMAMNKYIGFMGHALPPPPPPPPNHDTTFMMTDGVDEASEIMTSDDERGDESSSNLTTTDANAAYYLHYPASQELLFHDAESEVESSHFVTTPMLREDWSLMELRGWGASHSSSRQHHHHHNVNGVDDDDYGDYGGNDDDDDDARSEISCEMNPHNNVAPCAHGVL